MNYTHILMIPKNGKLKDLIQNPNNKTKKINTVVKKNFLLVLKINHQMINE